MGCGTPLPVSCALEGTTGRRVRQPMSPAEPARIPAAPDAIAVFRQKSHIICRRVRVTTRPLPCPYSWSAPAGIGSSHCVVLPVGALSVQWPTRGPCEAAEASPARGCRILLLP
jgi:hypothetical protein